MSYPRCWSGFPVVHPIPLTVADAVTEFHVLDAFRGGQRGGPQCPAGPASIDGDHEPCRDVEGSAETRWPAEYMPDLVHRANSRCRDGLPPVRHREARRRPRKGGRIRLRLFLLPSSYQVRKSLWVTPISAQEEGELGKMQVRHRGHVRSWSSYGDSAAGAGAAPDCEPSGKSAEQNVESAVEFGQSVVGRPGWRELGEGAETGRSEVGAVPAAVHGRFPQAARRFPAVR